jgi:hypothetical protein
MFFGALADTASTVFSNAILTIKFLCVFKSALADACAAVFPNTIHALKFFGVRKRPLPKCHPSVCTSATLPCKFFGVFLGTTAHVLHVRRDRRTHLPAVLLEGVRPKSAAANAGGRDGALALHPPRFGRPLDADALGLAPLRQCVRTRVVTAQPRGVRSLRQRLRLHRPHPTSRYIRGWRGANGLRSTATATREGDVANGTLHVSRDALQVLCRGRELDRDGQGVLFSH